MVIQINIKCLLAHGDVNINVVQLPKPCKDQKVASAALKIRLSDKDLLLAFYFDYNSIYQLLVCNIFFRRH